MKYKQMLKIRKTEKDPQVRDRILLNVLVKRDEMSVTGAALHLGMAPSWGVRWHNRYLKGGIAGLQTRTRSGRPPSISCETLKAVKKKSKKDNLPDGRRPARYHSLRFRHRVHDGVYDIVRALPAAHLGIHQEGSGGTAREGSKQAEDRVVPQEAGAVGRGEDEGRLHGIRAGRGDMRSRRAAQEGRLHAQGDPRRLYVRGIALQDHRVRPDHAGRGGVLLEIRLLYREEVCRVPEGRMREVRKSPDDNRRRVAAQVEIRQGGDRAPGRRGAAASAARLPGSERDRGGVAPDETRDPGRAVRPVQPHVQRHRQVAEVVPAKT